MRANKRSSSWPYIAFTAIVLALPILYFVSMGPVAWLGVNGYVAKEHVLTYFWPANWACTKSPRFHSVFIRYLDWWTTED